MNDSLGKFTRLTGAPSRLARFPIAKMSWTENERAFDRIAELGREVSAGNLPDLSLILTGSFGVGKTLLAVYLLRRAFEFWSPRSVSSVDFPRFFRSTDLAELRFGRSFSGPEDDEDRKAAARESLDRSPFAVIDDVQRVAGYRGEETFLESVVERRYDNELATVLTANELPREGRFADFVRYFEEVPLVGRSHRG